MRASRFWRSIMQHDEGATERRLLIQLARLGDLVQSLPAFASLTSRDPQGPLDLLCPAPLADIARLFPDVGRVVPWNGVNGIGGPSPLTESSSRHGCVKLISTSPS